MASLPQFQGDDKGLWQNSWKRILDPIVGSPTNNAQILKNITLTTGSNTINHKLGRVLQGWSFSRIRSACTAYDNQDNNQTPNLTLILVASADAVVDIVVF